jgi:hypothetical protein
MGATSGEDLEGASLDGILGMSPDTLDEGDLLLTHQLHAARIIEK